MASFLSALGRARPVDDIQNFLGKQNLMAVQDLQMQNTKQQMDIQARKEKTEVDAIELEKAKRAKPFHLHSNPIYNSLPDAQKEYIEKTMLESGITNAMGVTTQGDALDFLQQIETTRVGFDNVLKPVVEAKQQEAQRLTNRIREEKLKPNPNLKIIEALTAQQQEAYAQWGQSVTSLSAHDKWLTEREKEQNAIKLRGIPQATGNETPKTAMAAFLQKNPNATEKEIAAFNASLKVATKADDPDLVAIYNPDGTVTYTPKKEGLTGRIDKPGDGNSPTPTDIDDFVKDAELVFKAKNPTASATQIAEHRNKSRLQIKRAQQEEITANRFALRNVDALTAEKIKFNEKVGTMLAEIANAPALIDAKGEITPQNKKLNAQTRMSSNLATLSNRYIDLDSTGAMLNVDNSTFQNVVAAMRSSTMGQMFGRITGTNEQSIRSSILKIKPLLIQDIRQATDMGARGLDSEKELEFYLQAATDEKTDIQANIAAIVVLDEAYGDGRVANQLRSLTNESIIKRISQEGNVILNRDKSSEPIAETPQEAIDFLKANPDLKEAFKEKYGYIPEGL